jgi:hypothetical protein
MIKLSSLHTSQLRTIHSIKDIQMLRVRILIKMKDSKQCPKLNFLTMTLRRRNNQILTKSITVRSITKCSRSRKRSIKISIVHSSTSSIPSQISK